jgi:hypothetical protein
MIKVRWRRVVLFGCLSALVGVGYLAATPLPVPANAYTTPEWIGPVQVVDATTSSVASDRALQIRDGRIIRVVPVGTLTPDQRRALTDVGNSYAMPALWDMHAVLTRYAGSLEQPLNLAHGITRVRSILNCPSEAAVSFYACLWHKHAWNDEIGTGRRFGALTAASGSFPITGPGRLHPDLPEAFVAASPAQARRLVRLIARQPNRPDHIKTYDGVPRAAFFALIAQARAERIEVSGHVPTSVTAIEASDAGLKAIAHARILPIACSSKEREIMALRMSAKPAGEWMQLALASYDPARCRALWSKLKANGTFVSPTLITRYSETKRGIADLQSDSIANSITPGLVKRLWSEDVTAIDGRASQVDAIFQRYYDAAAARTAEASQAGVGLLVGSDTNDAWVAPGVGLHKEIELWHQAGIAPAVILRSATINAAAYFGRQTDMGRVAPGFVADLIFTSSNPLTEPRTLRTPSYVMQEGRMYDRGQLDGAIERARQIARGWRYPVHFLRDLIRNPLGFAT